MQKWTFYDFSEKTDFCSILTPSSPKLGLKLSKKGSPEGENGFPNGLQTPDNRFNPPFPRVYEFQGGPDNFFPTVF